MVHYVIQSDNGKLDVLRSASFGVMRLSGMFSGPPVYRFERVQEL